MGSDAFIDEFEGILRSADVETLRAVFEMAERPRAALSTIGRPVDCVAAPSGPEGRSIRSISTLCSRRCVYCPDGVPFVDARGSRKTRFNTPLSDDGDCDCDCDCDGDSDNVQFLNRPRAQRRCCALFRYDPTYSGHKHGCRIFVFCAHSIAVWREVDDFD